MENVRRFPRRGGRGLCVHGTVSFHRAGSRHMLAAQKPDPDSHRTLRPVVDPDTAWSVIALVNLAKVTHTNFRRAQSFPVWFWDVNNDGALDLFVSAYAAGIDDLMTSALDLPVDVDIARLYLGTGSGRFREAGEEYGIDRPTAPMGANFGDLDNDGHLDFYLGTGYPDLHNIMPNLMYRSRNGASFEDVTYTGGFGHIQKGHAVVFADLDHDGDQDIFEQMGGAYPIDGFTNVLYENPGLGNHWITVTLVGVRSNRSAIGARLRLEIVDDGVRRSIFRHVNSGGSFGANPLRQTIGLGQAPRIETLDVFWPMTGETQTFQSLSVDQVIEIVEDEAAYTTVPVETFRLGGG